MCTKCEKQCNACMHTEHIPHVLPNLINGSKHVSTSNANVIVGAHGDSRCRAIFCVCPVVESGRWFLLRSQSCFLRVSEEGKTDKGVCAVRAGQVVVTVLECYAWCVLPIVINVEAIVFSVENSVFSCSVFYCPRGTLNSSSLRIFCDLKKRAVELAKVF